MGKRGPHLHIERVEFFEDNLPQESEMTVGEYTYLYNAKRHGIMRFSWYHKLNTDQIEDIVDMLKTVHPDQLKEWKTKMVWWNFFN